MLCYIPCLLFLSTVYSQCKWPCSWVGKSFFSSRFGPVDVTTDCTATTGSETFTCQEIEGNFFLVRIEGTDFYSCFKVSEFGEDAYVSHQTTPVKRYYVPRICDLCTPEAFAEASPIISIRRNLVDLGCNVPKSCPLEGYGYNHYNQCTGREKDIPRDTKHCYGRQNNSKNTPYGYGAGGG